MRITIFCLCVLFALMSAAAPAEQRRPNIILILADDLGWGDVSFNGRTEWRTPNLDRLAAQGTVFRRWYVAAPLCCPSRAALLTGKYPIHNTVTGNNDDLPRDEVTIAEALKPLGYATALFGKWHRGYPHGSRFGYTAPMNQGFDEFFGFIHAPYAQQHFPTQLYEGRTLKPVKGYADTLFTDRSIEFIKRNKDRPFFLYLSYTAPHFNIEAPPEDVAEHKGKFQERDPARPLNATYAAMVTRMDREIGRLMRTLDGLGLTRNTLIVFTSDNGATFEPGNCGCSSRLDSNRPFRGGKRTLWEGGIRVPAVVCWTGKVPTGQRSNEVIHAIDLLPTFLAAAGGKPDPDWKVDGSDMLRVWMGKQKAPPRTLFWERRSRGFQQLTTMRGNLKLVIWGNNLPMLFNVETDPAERRDVIDERRPLAQRLDRELKSWLATEKPASVRCVKIHTAPPR